MTHRLDNPLVVTMGEAAGIGPDIIIQAWQKRYELELPAFYLVGDIDYIKQRAKHLNSSIETVAIECQTEISEIFSTQLPVLDFPLPEKVKPGDISPLNANYTINLIKTAVKQIHQGYASGLITAPIQKAVLYEAGFNFPGHTEYLAALSDEIFHQPSSPVMMLAADGLRVIPATIHIPLSEVSRSLSKDLLVQTVQIANNDLKSRFGLECPRIIITGLNPHSGEDGSLGREEIDIIIPAIEELKDVKINVRGPSSADVSFHESQRGTYDVAIAMYHDQALIPFKTLFFDQGVNVTLGLPFIRTSPDHGTALNIAGTGEARPDSFIASLKMAAQMVDNQMATSL